MRFRSQQPRFIDSEFSGRNAAWLPADRGEILKFTAAVTAVTGLQYLERLCSTSRR